MPMRAGHAAPHGPRRARRTATCSWCTCAARSAEGWAECRGRAGAHATPAEFTDAARSLRAARPPRAAGAGAGPPSATPLALGRALAEVAGPPDGVGPRSSWRCSTRSSAPPGARWRRGSAPPRPRSPPGAALGLHDDVDDLLAEADAALAAGAARLRVKIAPGRAARPAARAARPRRRRGDPPGRRQRLLQRGRPRARRASTTSGSPASSSRSPPDDLARPRPAGRAARHADLPRRAADVARRHRGGRRAGRVRGRVPQAGARRRVGRGPRACTTAAPSSGCRCGSAACSRPAIGRAANLAVAALPHLALPPDLDPRGRFEPDLADPRPPGRRRRAPCPPGRAPARSPTPRRCDAAEVVGAWSAVTRCLSPSTTSAPRPSASPARWSARRARGRTRCRRCSAPASS